MSLLVAAGSGGRRIRREEGRTVLLEVKLAFVARCAGADLCHCRLEGRLLACGGNVEFYVASVEAFLCQASRVEARRCDEVVKNQSAPDFLPPSPRHLQARYQHASHPQPPKLPVQFIASSVRAIHHGMKPFVGRAAISNLSP